MEILEPSLRVRREVGIERTSSELQIVLNGEFKYQQLEGRRLSHLETEIGLGSDGLIQLYKLYTEFH